MTRPRRVRSEAVQSPLETYLREINETPLLTADQEKELALRIETGDTTARDQMGRLRERFGQEILFHMEFMKNGSGQVIPGAIPLVYYTNEDRLNEMIAFCREIGVFVANPHVNNVEGGGRYRADNVQLLAKMLYDPKGLLNPGKMITFRAQEVAATGTTR